MPPAEKCFHIFIVRLDPSCCATDRTMGGVKMSIVNQFITQ